MRIYDALDMLCMSDEEKVKFYEFLRKRSGTLAVEYKYYLQGAILEENIKKRILYNLQEYAGQTTLLFFIGE